MKVTELTRAVEYIESAVVTGRPLRMIFEIVEGEGENHPTVDITVTEEGEHIFSDCNFESFEEALMAVGKNL